MTYFMGTKCTLCIEGQKKEDEFRCRQIGKRVFYSFQNQEEKEEEEKDERNLFICDRCHFWEARANDFSGVAQMAWTIMLAKEWTARKEAGCDDLAMSPPSPPNSARPVGPSTRTRIHLLLSSDLFHFIPPALLNSAGAFSSPTAALTSPSLKRFGTSRHGSEP
ncbi:hypothetical protein DAPPUDRAFT_259860 [Daphnia pulex]|uniref:Uncharacterized protein n=1 Tax=Daphnia pulex TaxID=6669 RepID=E9HI09_DAPPU|nr:hypothetical protein DAPPUDRAFT_259860 [Daphnia pulex]|eukprot:EFX68643.1 hypothetical protein DAPPUDRAFT_259860 [Daphnia pulex]